MKRLLPSDVISLSLATIKAIVLEVGGPASHAAILTREMGIPAVSQIEGVTRQVSTRGHVLVDGCTGRLVLAPNRNTRSEFDRRKRVFAAAVGKARKKCRGPAMTSEGTTIPIMANIGDVNDVHLARENGADGIGLYRLEQIYLCAKSLPSQKDLSDKIRQTLQPVANLPITIRLLDTGADKRISFLRYPHEENPALGLRGIRLLLRYPNLLKIQLRALLQISRDFNIRILVPMVTFIQDMKDVRDMLQEAAAEMGIIHLPPLGAMIETPAAALCAQRLARHADFLSIGTNDLTQYTMATGRENQLVFDYYEESHPAMLKLLKMIVEAVPDYMVEMCGEMASHLESIPELVQLGIRILSVAPLQIPVVKETVRSCSVHARNREAV